MGDVKAHKDIWVIGDCFLGEIFHTLQQMKTEAATAKKEMPYVYDYYNILCVRANPLNQGPNSSILVNMVNSLVHTLNENNKMPKYILVIPDSNVVNYVWKYKTGTSLMSGTAIDWIASQMANAVLCKKEFLRKIKPGAVVHFKPKFIWIKMLDVPSIDGSITHKFNTCLDEVLVTKDNHYIIDVNAELFDQAYFSRGELNGFGRVHFWKEVDNNIEEFNYKRKSLLPLDNNSGSKDDNINSNSSRPVQPVQPIPTGTARCSGNQTTQHNHTPYQTSKRPDFRNFTRSRFTQLQRGRPSKYWKRHRQAQMQDHRSSQF